MSDFKVTVSGNIGSFELGQVLTTASDIADYYRTCVNEGADNPVTLTDSEILAVVKATPVEAGWDDSDKDVARTEALEKSAKVTSVTVSAQGNAIRLNAFKVADKLTEAFDTDMVEGLKAKDTTDAIPLRLAFDLDAALPRAANGQIAVPVPGTPSIEKVKNPDGSVTEIKHDNPDRYVIKVGDKRVVGSYYQDILFARPKGKAINASLRQIDSAVNNNNDCDQIVTHPDGEVTTLVEYKAMGAKARKAAKARLEGQATFGTTKIRRAVSLLLQIEAVGGMDKVEVCLASKPQPGAPELKLAGVPVVEPGYVPIKSTRPIILIDRMKRLDNASDPKSITQFLGMDVNAALKAGGTMDALIATAERDTKAPTTVAAVASISSGDLTKWEDYAAETLAWLQNTDNYKLIVQAIANNKVSDEFILTIGDLNDLWGGIAGKLDRRYQALSDKREQAADTKAA